MQALSSSVDPYVHVHRQEAQDPSPKAAQEPMNEVDGDGEPGMEESAGSGSQAQSAKASSSSRAHERQASQPSLENFFNSISEIVEIFSQVIIEGGIKAVENVLAKTAAVLAMSAKTVVKLSLALRDVSTAATQTINDAKGVISRVSHDIQDTAGRSVKNLTACCGKVFSEVTTLASNFSTLFPSSAAPAA
jgi:hypothetical protein